MGFSKWLRRRAAAAANDRAQGNATSRSCFSSLSTASQSVHASIGAYSPVIAIRYCGAVCFGKRTPHRPAGLAALWVLPTRGSPPRRSRWRASSSISKAACASSSAARTVQEGDNSQLIPWRVGLPRGGMAAHAGRGQCTHLQPPAPLFRCLLHLNLECLLHLNIEFRLLTSSLIRQWFSATRQLQQIRDSKCLPGDCCRRRASARARGGQQSADVHARAFAALPHLR